MYCGLHDLAVRRSLASALARTSRQHGLRSAARKDARKSEIEQAEKALYQVAETSKYGEGPMEFHEALRRAVESAERAQARGGKISGVSSGFTDIDSLLWRLTAFRILLILAGRPGMGKTALGTNMAFHAARAYAQDVAAGGRGPARRAGFFSFRSKMAAQQLSRAYPVRADRDRNVEDPQRPLLGKRVGEIRSHHAGSFHLAALHRR